MIDKFSQHNEPRLLIKPIHIQCCVPKENIREIKNEKEDPKRSHHQMFINKLL